MYTAWRKGLALSALVLGYGLVGLHAAEPKPPAEAAPATERLTLDDVKQRVLHNNKLLQLAGLNIQSKGYATRAMQANYFPQIIGQSIYMHFDEALGEVLTTGSRTVHGPRGNPLGTIPSFTVPVAILNQDTAVNSIIAVQPITDLLKVRQGVKLAQADEGIARAQEEKASRELLSGAEQLFWGIWATQQIRAGMMAGAAPLSIGASGETPFTSASS